MGDRATGTGAAFDHAAAVMAAMVATGGYASAVAAVADRATTRWSRAVSGTTAADVDTIFPLASITKPILAVAVLQLVERGLVLLGDPVAAYLPEFGTNGKGNVTVWHLLTHSSGLAEFDDAARQRLDGAYIRREPRAALYAIACGLGLEHPPGARQRYSRIPWLVLGELIARVGGRDYPDWLRDELFAPLGMRDTGFAPADAARLAREPAALPELDTPEAWAYRDGLATDLYSTVPDLLALGRALLGGGPGGAARVLGPGAVAAMATPQPGLVAEEGGALVPVTTQGLGWALRSPRGNLLGSPRGFGHAGGTGGWLWIDPGCDLAFALLSNSAGPSQGWGMRLLNACYGALDRAADA
jgi:CubicO group peptidase (beta-lactamase class C family)